MTVATMRLTASAPDVPSRPGERWKAVPGRERRFSVSNWGRLYDHGRHALVAPSRVGVPLAETVATAFIGPPPAGKVAARLDPLQPISARNLAWLSPAKLPRARVVAPQPTGDPVADRLASVRVQAGLGRRVLGDAVGLIAIQVERIESGRTRPPMTEVISKWFWVCGAEGDPGSLPVSPSTPRVLVLSGA